MSKPDFTIVQFDLLPSIPAILSFSDGTIADLTAAASVQARFIRRPDDAVPTPSLITGVATIVDATAGSIRYDFTATQTDVAGDYDLTFRVDFGVSGFETFPTLGPLHLQITPQLA